MIIIKCEIISDFAKDFLYFASKKPILKVKKHIVLGFFQVIVEKSNVESYKLLKMFLQLQFLYREYSRKILFLQRIDLPILINFNAFLKRYFQTSKFLIVLSLNNTSAFPSTIKKRQGLSTSYSSF